MTKVRGIKQLLLPDQPREKLRLKGAAALSDFELLEVLIGSGTRTADVGYIARKTQRLLEASSDQPSYDALIAIKGVSVANASKLLAALELARRHLVRNATPLRTHQDVVARLHDIRTRQQEYLIALSLDGGQRLIAQRTITIGTLDTVIIHPREVFADAIADRAASIILAHNHPSGDVRPSSQDITLTQQLAAAGQLLGIVLYDHLVLTKTEHFSFRQHHLL
ncbi:MAG TPA: DNA repair protein RadC [Candidatus Saccharimonadales bacterium]|nr:DNA repair protein RadC [Candidatus Saccharimonadales bacterium]